MLVCLFISALCGNIAGAQTTLTNGANEAGTILVNTTNSYTFTANTGDSINLRLGTPSFDSRLQLYGPNETLLATVSGSVDNLIAYTPTNSGTFTVLVSSIDYDGGDSGTYVLNLSQIPEPFIVPGGDGGGPLTNGANGTGTITLGRQDLWSFPANKGDSINLRLGTTGCDGILELYGPNGALLGTSQGSVDDLITYTPTNNGTFTVLVSSYDYDGYDTGSYVLNLSQIPEPFIVPSGDGGGTLTNGANATGTITLGRQDLWSFPANKGDSINLRLGTTGCDGRLELYGPNGALLSSASGSVDNAIAYTPTNSGTFTVLVSSYDYDGYDTGSYVLNLSQIPEPFIVPAGDGGGTLTNGANATGTITLGRQDLWSFPANTGDSINLRLGTTGCDGILELYGPNGALLGTSQGSIDDLITYTPTNSGTFTVLVSSYDYDGYDTGSYVLNLSQIPEPFVVPAGDGGGTLTNGANATGTITLGRQDLWSFPANKGDSINLRLGTTGCDGRLELYGPNGALLGTYQGSVDDLITYTPTNSGTFTVLVSSYDYDGYDTGSYVLNLSQIPEPFIVPSGDGGGTLTNGANATGTITLGRQDLWSFPANKGDSINLRLGTTGCDGILELYGPNGALLGTYQGSVDDLIAYTPTNSGTFTVLVSSYDYDGNDTGTYVLNLSQIPEPFVVPAGDGGGPLINGTNGTGTITLGRQDLWSFPANKGDSINLRLGTTGCYGMLELYGPNGALLGTSQGSIDDLITYTPTNSGTFTVLVSSYDYDGNDTGTYALYLAQMPEPFVVPPGGQGGEMDGSSEYTGALNLAQQVMWAFTACQGDPISLQLNTTNFYGKLQLYGSNGALLKTAEGSTDNLIAYAATNCGTFTILVSSYDYDGADTGTYGLTVNGLLDDFRLCSPVITTDLSLNGVGGPTNAVAVLLTTTNLATPLELWVPIITNHIDQFGVFSYTNNFNPTEPKQFFQLYTP